MNVSRVGEYVQMLAEADSKRYVCRMIVDMMGLEKDDFVVGVIGIVKAEDFIAMTKEHKPC